MGSPLKAGLPSTVCHPQARGCADRKPVDVLVGVFLKDAVQLAGPAQPEPVSHGVGVQVRQAAAAETLAVEKQAVAGVKCAVRFACDLNGHVLALVGERKVAGVAVHRHPGRQKVRVGDRVQAVLVNDDLIAGFAVEGEDNKELNGFSGSPRQLWACS